MFHRSQVDNAEGALYSLHAGWVSDCLSKRSVLLSHNVNVSMYDARCWYQEENMMFLGSHVITCLPIETLVSIKCIMMLENTRRSGR